MRVLWISNIELTDESKGSGSWIFSMAHALLSEKGIILGNIVPMKTKKVSRSDFKSIQQWKIPRINNVYNTVLSNRDVKNILNIVSVFKPDIIHIWGIENGFALITPHVKCPVLIEIQGINSEIAKYYYGGFSLIERLELIRFKEIITFNPICRQKNKMAKMYKRESRIFDINKYFTTPTDWMKANIEARKNGVLFFTNGFILRDEFYRTEKWNPNNSNIILTSASIAVPFKGIHILLDALSILKKKFQHVELRIIGSFINRGIKTDAYIYLLKNKIKKLGLDNNVIWLGSLNDYEICEQIKQSSVFVNPSFIESAGLTVLEAMAVGIPVVSSYTGGIPSFNSGSVLFFPPGDFKMCAFQIAKALTDKEIILSSEKMSRAYISKYHNKEFVVKRQLDIYSDILKNDL